MAKLEQWAIVSRTTSPYQAPELGIKCLNGLVSGHPGFPDGERVTTSGIKSVRTVGTILVVTTKSGTEYELGEVNPEYEAEYPGAADRLAAMEGKENNYGQ